MIQHIEISNQPTDILGNSEGAQKAPNSLKNMLYYTRSIPIDISNLVISPNYIKSHVNLTKIDLMSFLEI